MRKRLIVAVVASSAVLTACGLSPNLNKFGFSQSDRQPTSGDLAKDQRYKALGTIEECPTCWITGGGAGNELACEGAKFGLNAHDEPDKGHLQFQFEDENTDLNVGGKVDSVTCNLLADIDGDGESEGTVFFTGTLSKTLGLDECTEDYRFEVTATDIDEPNEATDDELKVQIFCGTSTTPLFSTTCFTEDGNLQIHPTRAAQIP